MMQTTLTLEDDVALALQQLEASQGLRGKALINEALRRGLRSIHENPEAVWPGNANQAESEERALAGVGASVPDWLDWDAQRWF